MRLISIKAVLAAVLSVSALALVLNDGLSDRNFYIRIGIIVDTRYIAIKPTSNYKILHSDGKEAGTLAANELYYVRLGTVKSSDKIFRVVIREFDSDADAASAASVVKGAEAAFGLPARTLRLPPKGNAKSGGLIVTVGEFATMAEAKAYQQSLKGIETGRVFEDRASAGGGRMVIQARGGSLVASDGFSLKLLPTDLARDSLFMSRASSATEFDLSGLKGERHYRGNVAISVNGKGTLTAVNHVWLEQYVYGVVAAELGNFAPLEGLKAQAVTARSECVAKFERGMVSGDPLYDFDDSAMIQSYKGMGEENTEVRRAVDATRGEVLVSNGQTIDAVYSHSCGGVISSMNDQWGGEPKGYSVRLADRDYKRDVGDLSTDDAARVWTAVSQDVYCNPLQRGFPQYAMKNFRWAKRYSAADLERLFTVGKVQDIKVTRRSKSGRVQEVKVTGDKRSQTIRGEMDVRAAFGDIKSTFFTFDLTRGGGGVTGMELKGAGFGHGVGMCQMGAYMMAIKGQTYRRILAYYYVNVAIRDIYKTDLARKAGGRAR